MTGYHPVDPPPRWRWRRRLRRVRWLGLAWIAGTGVVAWWWVAQPAVGWLEAASGGAAFAVLLGAALGQRQARQEGGR